MKNNNINRNYFWADLFVNQLLEHGVRDVCISPGSRNTPLTIAFAGNSKIAKYIHADERSSGFFALGLSKSSDKPVAIVTTSGTAVAELYPAIIEAYYQRISLIICTADRPGFLRDIGANQTINQVNIFGNHIRHFAEIGLPTLNEKKLKSFVSNVNRGIKISKTFDKGPIHFNFPFKKPLEPSSYTDQFRGKIKNFVVKLDGDIPKGKKGELKKLILAIENSDRPLIHCGWGTFTSTFFKQLLNFSRKSKIPILADGSTSLRFEKSKGAVIISNHSSFLNHLAVDSDLIIQFGNAPTSASMLNYLENTKAKRFLINEFGDIKDPSKQKGILIKSDLTNIIDSLLQIKMNKNWRRWSEEVIEKERIAESSKSIVRKSKFGNESRIIMELLDLIPKDSNLFISNSLPIRDFDYFSSKVANNLKVFVNRGASGIDGIISTASGIAADSKKPTFLLIGDLAFYHNISALSTLDEYNIPLKIILINNSGGNIFRMLPVAKEKRYFEKYFITPQQLNHKRITLAFGGQYNLVRSWVGFRRKFDEISRSNSFSVMEFITDPHYSVKIRNEYWSVVKKIMNS